MKGLVPILLQLHILQLEGYQLPRFGRWIATHIWTRHLENKKPLVWTTKARILLLIAALLMTFVVVFLSLRYGFVGLTIALISLTQPYIFLSAAVLLFKPYEIVNRRRVKARVRQKLVQATGTKVIGITGSYGKTTTKEFLYYLLRSHFRVLKTPESYNTLFGIAKVVDLEFDGTYDFFVCEMGAYHIGEIREMCEMTQPTYGILTGINEQHLERFGSIENTTQAKFELIDAIPSQGFALVNTDNKRICDHYQSHKTHCTTYGLHEQAFCAYDVRLTDQGTTFKMDINGGQYPFTTPLLGNANLSNVVGAIGMAYKLDVPIPKLQQAVQALESIPHRLELKQLSQMTLIDDAYNSNVTGFTEALRLLESFKDRPKILVTPGIVELGRKTVEVHQTLAAIANETCDHVFLVGRSDRTEALASKMDSHKYTYLQSVKEYPQAILRLNVEHPVVLLENDLTDNY
jgi:UDP-N-acetylmuramoyl-tripeptide--D-alanyl-D-alanine ligase